MKGLKSLKGVCFLMLIFVFAATNLSGQNFFGGLILGGTTSQSGGDMRGGYNKVGLVGGAFAGLNLSEDVDIQMELKYIQKGSYSTDMEYFPAFDPFLIKLDYIDLPVVWGYNLNKINVNDVNLKWLKLEFGLSLDVLLNARQEIRGVTVTASNPWRRFVVNTVVGFRVSVKDNVDIGLRAVNAMTSICKTSKMPYSNGNVNYLRRLFPRYGMFNDVLQLAVFWRI